MRWETTVIDQNTLPFVDLNRQRREERRLLREQNRRSLYTLGILVGFALVVLVPLSHYTALLSAKCERIQSEAIKTESGYRIVAEESARLDSRAQCWIRYVHSRDRRRIWSDALRALGARTLSPVCLEMVMIEVKDTQVLVALQGSSETLEALQQSVHALTDTSLFGNMRLIETVADPVFGPQGM